MLFEICKKEAGTATGLRNAPVRIGVRSRCTSEIGKTVACHAIVNDLAGSGLAKGPNGLIA